MSSWVLDSSALLTLLNQETGEAIVAQAIAAGAVMCSVNLAEVVTKFADAGMTEETIRGILDPLAIPAIDFDTELAYTAGMLRPITRTYGLSLGDRACLALARR